MPTALPSLHILLFVGPLGLRMSDCRMRNNSFAEAFWLCSELLHSPEQCAGPFGFDHMGKAGMTLQYQEAGVACLPPSP